MRFLSCWVAVFLNYCIIKNCIILNILGNISDLISKKIWVLQHTLSRNSWKGRILFIDRVKRTEYPFVLPQFNFWVDYKMLKSEYTIWFPCVLPHFNFWFGYKMLKDIHLIHMNISLYDSLNLVCYKCTTLKYNYLKKCVF